MRLGQPHADHARDAALDHRPRRRRCQRRDRRWRHAVVRERDQRLLRPVEDVLVPGELDRLVRPLPERVSAPTGRERADAVAPAGDPQRASAEAGVVPRALLPPVRGRVDRRPAAGAGAVLVQEAADPRDHRALAQAVARRPVRVVLDVERAGECLVVGRPGAAVGGEEGSLRGTARPIRECEVVRAAHEPDLLRPDVLLREVRIDVGRALGCLDVREARPVGGHGRPVDVSLPAAHVETGEPGGPEHLERAEVALGELRAGVVALGMHDRARGAERRACGHEAGEKRDQRGQLPSLQTHRAKLTSNCYREVSIFRDGRSSQRRCPAPQAGLTRYLRTSSTMTKTAAAMPNPSRRPQSGLSSNALPPR